MAEGKRVLVVEDEAPLREMLVKSLSNDSDITVLEAKDGEEGLTKAIKELPDLILLDINLPKMDGMTVLKKMREDEKGADIPVIILTNLSDFEKVGEALDNKAYNFLIKSDWELDDIKKKVRNLLGI
jgi:two-component system response regulator RpaA